MQVFDLRAMEAQPYEARDRNVFYETQEFKARVIELAPGGAIPSCEMAGHVIFYVLSGEAEVTVNGQTSNVAQGQCLISPPATFSMHSRKGVRMMGVQVAAGPRS